MDEKSKLKEALRKEEDLLKKLDLLKAECPEITDSIKKIAGKKEPNSAPKTNEKEFREIARDYAKQIDDACELIFED